LEGRQDTDGSINSLLVKIVFERDTTFSSRGSFTSPLGGIAIDPLFVKSLVFSNLPVIGIVIPDDS
jgi:hypothetical protein